MEILDNAESFVTEIFLLEAESLFPSQVPPGRVGDKLPESLCL
jgi:hypothetical protein